MEEVSMDRRFESLGRDHRFRPIRQAQKKVRIDKRFHGLFFKKAFQESFTLDKRGRPVKESTSKNLRKFYHLSHDEKKRIYKERQKAREELQKRLEKNETPQGGGEIHQAETDGDVNEQPVHGGIGDGINSNVVELNQSSRHEDVDDHSNDSDSSHFSSDDDSDIDLARGKGNVESSSEEEFDFDDAINNNDMPEHGWGEMDNEAPRSEETSRRLALCSMDWDHVRSSDIFVLLDSFKPTGGSIESVIIYPSEYGVKRMKEEQRMGPAELQELKSDEVEIESGRHTEESFNTEKLRQYELNRLKYFYAVVVCDSAKTAEKIYHECDGLEFETTSSKLDLRFIPDALEFDDFPPKEQTLTMPDTLTYKPVSFVTAALNMTKVNLTWDETDHSRTALTKSKFSKEDLENMDVRDFLASSSGSESEDEKRAPLLGDLTELKEKQEKLTVEDRVEMYRKALLGDNDDEEEDDVDMEVTWEPDLKPTVERDIILKDSGESNKRKKSKKLEQKMGRNETNEAELEMIIDESIGDRNMAARSGENFELDVDDDRFSALYRSSKFAIDRSNSLFKKTDAMEKLVQERQKRVKKQHEDVTEQFDVNEAEIPVNVSVSSLVKSIKAKSASLTKKKSTNTKTR